VQVGALTAWSQIAAGALHSLAVKTDGTLWSWGSNSYGQLGLGDGYTISRSSPVQVGALTNWADVAAGYSHSIAVKTDGTLWSWGNNGSGRLGQNNTINRSSPVQVGALTGWVQASGASESSSAVKNDGTLWSWGRNNNGQLGLNDTANRSSPVQVGALATWSKIAIGSRAEHMLVLKG
jgi:alpha-tubulin suppressor-like RCC1 family protein